MEHKCYFCDIQGNIDGLILENDAFFSAYDKAPVNKGHALVISKQHVLSFFHFTSEQITQLYDFIKATKTEIDRQHRPDGYNIGVNDGKAAGRSIDHVHIHLIPRYAGDVENPRGGIRNMFPNPIAPALPPKEYR